MQYRSVTDTQPASQPATQPRCRSYYAQRSGVEPNNKYTDKQYMSRLTVCHNVSMQYHLFVQHKLFILHSMHYTTSVQTKHDTTLGQ